MTDITGRYLVFGASVSEHEENNDDLDPSRQKVEKYTPVYGTDDREEAKAIVNAGGFRRGEEFIAVLWAEDTVDGRTFGDKPADSSGGTPEKS